MNSAPIVYQRTKQTFNTPFVVSQPYITPLSVSGGHSSPSQKTKKNTGTPSAQERFYILDLVRLVAMILMMQGHTLDAVVSPQYLNITEFPWNLWHFLRGLTAPMFLMISGAVQIFATKRAADGSISSSLVVRRLRWAALLIGVGYLLVFPANRLMDLPFVSAEGWRLFCQVNILQLSGITLCAVMLVMIYTKSHRTFAYSSLGIGLVLTFLAPVIDNIHWFEILPEWLAAYLSHEHGSLFTIFPYSAYMFFGVGVGALLAEIPVQERAVRFPRFALSIGCVLFVVGMIGTYNPVSIYTTHNYYVASPNFVALRVGCTLVFMGLLTYLYRYTRSFEQYYSRLGKKSLYIYTVHLVLLFGTPWFSGITRQYYHALTLWEGFVLASGVITFSLVTAYLLDYYQRHSHNIRQGIRFSLTAIVLYALIV